MACTVQQRGVQLVGVNDDTANECKIYIKIKLPVVGVLCLKMTRTNEETTSPSKQVLVQRGGGSENEEIETGDTDDVSIQQTDAASQHWETNNSGISPHRCCGRCPICPTATTRTMTLLTTPFTQQQHSRETDTCVS